VWIKFNSKGLVFIGKNVKCIALARLLHRWPIFSKFTKLGKVLIGAGGEKHPRIAELTSGAAADDPAAFSPWRAVPANSPAFARRRGFSANSEANSRP
jgi:hypothetical protein